MKKKYIWTYSTKFQKNSHNIFDISLLALSIQEAKKHASDIVIYTDSLGKDILYSLGIREKYDLLLDEIAQSPIKEMYVYPKMFVLSRQSEPIIHLSNDVVVREDFSLNKNTADIVTEFLETPETESIHFHEMKMYKDAYSFMLEQNPKTKIFDFIEATNQNEPPNILGYNCGFIDVNNLDSLKVWAKESLRLFNLSLTKNKQFHLGCNILFERSLLYFLSQKLNWQIGTLFDANNVPSKNYFHAKGRKNNIQDLAPKVLELLENKNSIIYEKIEKKINSKLRKKIKDVKCFKKDLEGKIIIKDEDSKKDLYSSLRLFVNFIFSKDSKNFDRIEKIRSIICGSLKELGCCTPENNLAENFEKTFLEKYDLIFDKFFEGLLKSNVQLESLNNLSKKMLIGKAMNSVVNKNRKISGQGPSPSVFEINQEEQGPSLLKMAGSFASAMKDFAGSGFLRVTEEQHAARMDICNGCEFWEQGARFGMGKCLKCGCTGAKQWIATSVCPINKWGAISKEEVEASLKEKENAEAQETQSPVSQQADGSSQEPSPEVQG